MGDIAWIFAKLKDKQHYEPLSKSMAHLDGNLQ